MNYRQQFPGPAIFPVIHVEDYAQAARNLAVCTECGTDGAFLIMHTGDARDLVAIIRRLVKPGKPHGLWLGANFLGVPVDEALDLATSLGLDGLWADNWMRTSDGSPPPARTNGLLFFGGFAFKYQLQPLNFDAAQQALPHVDIITTSGAGTGRPAHLEKLDGIRRSIGKAPLATASGVDLGNVTEQLKYVDAVLVSTGICTSFTEINPDILVRMTQIVHNRPPS